MPLLWLSLALLSGTLLSASLAIPALVWILVAVLSLILLLRPVSRFFTSHLTPSLNRLPHPIQLSPPTFYPLLVLCLAFGAIRYQLAQPKIDPTFIAYYNNQDIQTIIEGVVDAPPDVRDAYVNLRLKVEQLSNVPVSAGTVQNVPVHGLLLARVPAYTAYNYGDRLRLQGVLLTPPENEGFSYRDYLANHGIYSYMAYPVVRLFQPDQGNPFFEILYAFRQHGLNLIYDIYPDPEASLIAGILLGVQSGISPEVQEAFRLTGTSHIIVISGFNISIIAALFTLVFSRLLGVRRGMIVSIIGIIFYTLLVGANPAVVRAAILGIIALLGHQIGRGQVGLNSLAFVAAIMVIFTPTVLWDVSFQLSFAATLGIILYAEPFTQWFSNLVGRFSSPAAVNRIAGPVSAYFLLTLAAQLTTLPLMIYYFKRISLTSLIANPLILPAQPPLMVLGGLSVLTGMIFKPLGQLFAWAAWPFTAYTIRTVEWLARVPHGSVPLGQVALPLIVFFYITLFILTFSRSRLTPLISRLTPAIPLALMGVLTVIIWKTAFFAPDGLLHVTILSVGTGDAVLVQTPLGRSLLINGGPSTLALSDALGRRLPPFSRTLDWLVVADIDSEDLNGITANLERFPPANVLWAGNPSATRTTASLQTQLIAQGIPLTPMLPGQSLELGSDASLQVISTNPKGAVLLLIWGNFRLLLPMGMDFTALDSLQKDLAMRNVSAVMLPESGFAPLNPPELIDFLHPQLALLSVAPADKTGLPSPETIQAVEGYNLLRTDQNGWIELTTDGSQMWVEVERK